MLSTSEENYLKAIYKISENAGTPVSTNKIAHQLETAAASVTDMLKKLSEKKLINYQIVAQSKLRLNLYSTKSSHI